ncbi:MAG: hypothetical protein ACREVI_14310 [Steroidobacteraceae bacterium]
MDNGVERLHQIIGVDARIKATQLALLGEPLETTRLRLVVPGKNEGHVADLRIGGEVWPRVSLFYTQLDVIVANLRTTFQDHTFRPAHSSLKHPIG